MCDVIKIRLKRRDATSSITKTDNLQGPRQGPGTPRYATRCCCGGLNNVNILDYLSWINADFKSTCCENILSNLNSLIYMA